MIHKNELLYPICMEGRSDYEKEVIDGAQNAGHSPRFTNDEKISRNNHAGALQQVISMSAIRAAECGAPGCDSDISDGVANLREFFEMASAKYNQ